MATLTINALSSAPSVGTTDEIELQRIASSTTEKTTIGALARGVAEGSAGFIRSETGATARSIRDRLRDAVSLADFGGDPTGVADSASAFQAALNTGKCVVVPGGSYKIQSALTFTADEQVLSLYGTKLYPAGSFDVFSIGAYRNCGIMGGLIDATSMTGGYMFSVSGSSRTTIRDVELYKPYNFVRAQNFNWLLLDNVWCDAIQGSFGVYASGTDSLRSDVLVVRNCAIAGTSSNRPPAIVIDGFVNSVDLIYPHTVNIKHGLWTRNTGGGTQTPAFIRCVGFAADFCSHDCVRLDEGSLIHFDNNTYLNGGQSTTGQVASGIYVGTNIAASTVFLGGGYIIGNGRYGIEDGSSRAVLGGDVYFNGNLLGNVLGDLRRQFGDNGYYAQMISGNPFIGFDTNDYLSYDRTANKLAAVIGASTRLDISSTGLGFNGTAAVAKPTVTGSRGSNAALQSLLAALASMGLITDSTS